MLCRALLAAVVLSYVLCVLLLSGVQKEDIDAGTLRKLQRHNVNIDDINDQQLQKQCLGKTSAPVTLSTTQANLATETPNKLGTAKEIPTDKSTEDMAQLEKIVKYLEYKRKKEKDKTSTLKPTKSSTSLSTSSFRDRAKNTNFEDTRTRKILREMSDFGKNDVTANNIKINKKLENLMNIWKTEMNEQPVTTQQEISTVNLINEDSKLKIPKDVEYISKIVEEIMSKKLINVIKNTTVDPKPINHNPNDNFRHADNITDAQYQSMMMQPTNYFLENCKLGNFYGGENKPETIGNENELHRTINDPITNTKYYDNICKRNDQKEKKILTDRIQDSSVYNIFSKLKKEQSIGTAIENQLRNGATNPQYNLVKTNNNYNQELNALGESVTPIKNQSQNSISNTQSKPSKISDMYNFLDSESAKALETALETQSNIVKQLFNRQRNLVTNDKERLRVVQNENRNKIISAILVPPTTISYNPSKQDNYQVDKGYRNWHFKVPHPLDKQQETMHQRGSVALNNNNGYSDKEKSTNIRMQYDEEQGQQYKRPWFYREASNEKLPIKKKEKPTWSLFEPNDDRKINNMGSILKNTNGKKWSPYFDTADKSSRIIPTDELETPKHPKSILVNSHRLVQPQGEILRERMKKKLTHFNGLYRTKNEPPNYGKDRSSEQIETKPNLCQLTHETRIECLSDNEYKSNWAYFRNSLSMKQKPNTEEPNEEKEYFNYRFPSRPRSTNHHNTDVTKNRFAKYIPEGEIYNKNETKADAKIAAFPPNVIKDIANSIKEIVFKGLITTTITPPAKKTPTTTTISTTPTTLSTTTTTLSTTMTTLSTTTATLSTTTTATPTTPKPTTITYTTNKPTEGTTKLEDKQPLKIQDASKALEKIMEMFEQINKMKYNKGKNEDVKDTEDIPAKTKTEVTTELTVIQHQEMLVQQTAENLPQIANAGNRLPYNPQLLQFNQAKIVPYQQQPIQYPQSGQMKTESRMPYFPLALQQTAENNLPYDPRTFRSNSENLTPYFPPVLQQRSENSTQYFPHSVQIKAENRLPYEPSTFQSNSNRLPYFPPQVRPVPENPYILQAAQGTKENQTLYATPTAQVKIANSLPYNPQALSNPENHTPYFPPGIGMRVENRISYTRPAVQMQGRNQLPQDLEKIKRDPAKVLPYFAEARENMVKHRAPYDPQPIHSSPENRMPYGQQSLQSLGNQMSYDPRTLQDYPENNVPSDTHPLQMNTGINYDPQSLKNNPSNNVPYSPQSVSYGQGAVQLQTDIREPYDAHSSHSDPKNVYNMKPSYFNSKIQLDPYSEKEVIHPFKPKPKPRKYAITVQTNSGEIAPLKIEVRKPIVQTIMLTTKSPEKSVQRSDESLENERPWKKVGSSQRQVNKLKINQYVSRHTHKDAYIEHPKSRKTKKEPEVPQRHKAQYLQNIERFHEKLERQDTWSQREEEKIAKRMQRPIVKNTNYDDTHFRNFLQTQQKVNAMLERILSSAKNKQISSEVV